MQVASALPGSVGPQAANTKISDVISVTVDSKKQNIDGQAEEGGYCGC